jgi:hypothetical protein
VIMRRLGRRRVVACVLGSLLLPVLTGCGGAIVGHWYLAKATPNRDVFAIDDATFRGDGTFSATTTIDGRTADETGTYRFEGFALTLRPQGGGQRRYTTFLKLGTLEVKDGDRLVVLKKGRKGG